MSSSTSFSDDDVKPSQFVLVEWDDGSMVTTDWYLGVITDYDAQGRPKRFRDIGVGAYPEERFLFSSCLMQQYMVYPPTLSLSLSHCMCTKQQVSLHCVRSAQILQNGDMIRGKRASKEAPEEQFKISIVDETLSITNPDGTSFDFEHEKLSILGVTMPFPF